jgi:hypothetical protein
MVLFDQFEIGGFELLFGKVDGDVEKFVVVYCSGAKFVQNSPRQHQYYYTIRV